MHPSDYNCPFHGLFMNFMLPKRRFWKSEPTFPNAFAKHLSMSLISNRVLTPLKSSSKIRISSFVPPSKIFVWVGKNACCAYQGYMQLRNVQFCNEET